MLNQNYLKEDTLLIDRYFPFNIFYNIGNGNNILYLHWHDNIEVIYVIDGHAVFDIGARSIDAVPDDILFVNSGQLHSGYSVNNTEVKYYAIVFSKSLLNSQYPDPYHLKYINPFIEGEYLFPVKLNKEDDYYINIREIVLDIIKEFNNKLPGFEIIIRNSIQSLAVKIIRHYLPLENERKNTFLEYNIESFKKLISYINENYSEKITVEQAASLVNLSTSYFCRIFKKITGRTFVEYLNLYRVNKAEELLRSTTLSVTQIAEKVGICNINYFSKIFKKFKRYSPLQCRKQ